MACGKMYTVDTRNFVNEREELLTYGLVENCEYILTPESIKVNSLCRMNGEEKIPRVLWALMRDVGIEFT